MYRHFFPDEKVNCYTYWGYRFNARAKNKGWRLDYFLTDSEFLSRVDRIWIDSQQLGSDHAPLILNIHK